MFGGTFGNDVKAVSLKVVGVNLKDSFKTIFC